MDTTVTYPIYRKYKNGKSYFKVMSHEEFEEIQLGVRPGIYHFVARILPDRNLIHDMTFDFQEHWEEIEEEEYAEVRARLN